MTVQVEVVEAVTPAFVRQELWPRYRRVFGDFDDYEAWRDHVWARHSARTGFRIALARKDEDLAGFAYGYTGEHGQWWTDTAATVLHPDVASDWLGGHFELVSIGVAESARGASVGRRLLTALTAGLEHGGPALGRTPCRQFATNPGWLSVRSEAGWANCLHGAGIGRSTWVEPARGTGGAVQACSVSSPESTS